MKVSKMSSKAQKIIKLIKAEWIKATKKLPKLTGQLNLTLFFNCRRLFISKIITILLRKENFDIEVRKIGLVNRKKGFLGRYKSHPRY